MSADLFVHVLEYLDRNEVEKSQLVSWTWDDAIRHSKLLLKPRRIHKLHFWYLPIKFRFDIKDQRKVTKRGPYFFSALLKTLLDDCVIDQLELHCSFKHDGTLETFAYAQTLQLLRLQLQGQKIFYNRLARLPHYEEEMRLFGEFFEQKDLYFPDVKAVARKRKSTFDLEDGNNSESDKENDIRHALKRGLMLVLTNVQ